MAGLRLGWCYGPEWVVDILTRIGPSFPVNTASYAAGIASVEDSDHVNAALSHNSKWVTRFSEKLKAMGLKVYPSQTNFMLVEFPPACARTADETNRHLNENGIIPRQFAVEDFQNKLRFTVGQSWEMEKTIESKGRAGDSEHYWHTDVTYQ
jgi:histidinol-phosphate aminotransferase